MTDKETEAQKVSVVCPSSFLGGLGDSGPSALTRRLNFYHFCAARPKGVFRGREHPDPGPAKTPGCELAGNSPLPQARLGLCCGDVTHLSVPSPQNGALAAQAKSAAGRATLPGTSSVRRPAAHLEPPHLRRVSPGWRLEGPGRGAGRRPQGEAGAPAHGRTGAGLQAPPPPGPARPPRAWKEASPGQRAARRSAHLRRWQEAGPAPTRLRSRAGEKPLEVRSRRTSLSPDTRRTACGAAGAL